MGVEFAPTTRSDLFTVICNLRDFDLCEMSIFRNKLSPTEIVMDAYEKSDFCNTVLLNNEPMAIFGCVVYSQLTSHAIPFFFATQESERHPMTFARSSRRAMKFYDRYNLANFTLTRNKTALSWLERNLGFTLGDEVNVNNAQARIFRRDACATQ